MFVLLAVGSLLPAAQLHASIFVASGARPTLAVDAKGDALVRWPQDSVFVPPKGQLFHGGSLSGPDVSRRVGLALPMALTVRRTPDGTLWALQSWVVEPGKPPEVHLARWKGAPTKLTLASDGIRVTGTVSFQGKPVTGRTFTLEGKRPGIYVYVDCFGCPAAKPGAWARMTTPAPRADGSFRVHLRPEWMGKRYRATVSGPNIGTTFAPDARAVIAG
jgi:hypothetical protein